MPYVSYKYMYSTAQLKGNVRTRLKRMQDASGTHARCVRASAKPRDKAAARRTWVPCQMGARPERVWDASEMCVNITLELSCTVDTNQLLYYIEPIDFAAARQTLTLFNGA